MKEMCKVHLDVPFIVRESTSVNGGHIGWGCAVCNMLKLDEARRSLDVCSRGFDAMAKRALAAEAEVARLNMEMAAYREPCTLKDAAAMFVLASDRRYREEDTDLHRELRRMESDHATALRREEEKGYARGLRDAGYVEPGCSPSRPENLSTGPALSDEAEHR